MAVRFACQLGYQTACPFRNVIIFWVLTPIVDWRNQLVVARLMVNLHGCQCFWLWYWLFNHVEETFDVVHVAGPSQKVADVDSFVCGEILANNIPNDLFVYGRFQAENLVRYSAARQQKEL